LAEEFIWGAGEQTLAGVTGDLLRRHQLKVSTAESCTGGLLSSYITDISGSSDYFERGFITYSNSAKMELLGVSPETLEKYGAVSEQTVTEMVAGLLSHPQTDYAIAVSGIVGPVGGTSDKPVGLVYTAVGNRGHTTVKKLTLAASRIVSKKMAATAALNLLRLRMIEDLQK
jgi:nicotinamide-nucleotide amidase